MPWNFLSPSQPQRGVTRRLCFYCNEKSFVDLTYRSSTNSYEWTCPLCEAINFIDETGEIMDFAPEAFSPSESDQTILSSTNHETESPFCKNCQVNHRIVMEALASYLPPESGPQYQEYEQSLPRYKEELERRFPPYCDKCRSKVISKLSENNYNARARILGTFLKNKESSAELRSSPFNPMTDGNESVSPSGGRILRPRWTFQTWLKLFILTCQGALWWSHVLGFVGLFAINSLYPSLQIRKLALTHAENNRSIMSIFKVVFDATLEAYVTSNRPHDAYLSELAVSLFYLLHRITPISILYFFWNYKLFYALLSSVRVSVTGKSDYYRCQCLLFVQLLVGLYTLPRMYYWGVSEIAFRIINIFFATTTTLMLAVSLACLKMRPVESTDIQPQVQYRTDDSYSGMTEQGQSLSLQNRLQRNLSVNIPQVIPSRRVVTSPTHGVDEQTMVIDDDMMDWKPSFVPEISMIDAAPAELPDIPKLPRGYSLAPPPNGSKLNIGTLNPSALVRHSSASTQGKEKYFQHKLASVSHTQRSATATINDQSNRDIGLAAQRFFPKEEPTGLEDLFDPVLRLSDSAGFTGNSVGSESLSRKVTRTNDGHKPREWLSASAIVIGLLAVVIYLCRRVIPVPEQLASL
ncbi:Ima1 N-terminal domain-containing protein, partial [Lipomyces kononenkoae]